MSTTILFSLLTACSDDDDSSDSDSDSQSDNTSSDDNMSDINRNYEYVDLGLPSGNKWATFNIGVYAPDYYGCYFAWDEIATKSSYIADNCSTYDVQISSIQGDEKYDAATAICADGDWLMPQLSDWVELANECTWKGFVYGDGGVVSGVSVTGPNGNSIFLPFAGYMKKSTLTDNEYAAYFWSATPISSSTQLPIISCLMPDTKSTQQCSVTMVCRFAR